MISSLNLIADMAECMPSRPKLETTCPICLDTFQRPRSLPCLHTFCTSCLQAHIMNTAQSGLLSAFFCPVCRSQTKAARPYSQRDTWAEQFPLNHWIVTFMDETEKEESKDDVIFCNQHSEFTVRLYCMDHKCPCCPMCIATDHRKCDDVKELEEMTKQFDASDETDLFRENLNTTANFIRTHRRNQHQCIASFVSKREDVIHKITDKRAEIINHLDLIEANVLDDIERATDSMVKTMEDEIDWCNAADEIIDGCNESIDRTGNGVSPMNTFIVLSQLKNKTKNIISTVRDRQAQPQNTIDMEFEFSDKIKSIQEDIKSFGTFSIKSNNDKTDLIVSTEISDDDHALQLGDFSNYDADATKSSMMSSGQRPALSNATWYTDTFEFIDYPKVENEGSGNAQLIQCQPVGERVSENSCWITSIASMQNGCTVICDKTNNSLKMYKDGSFISETTQASYPWSVARVNENSIAVTYPQENIVRFYDVYMNDIIVKFMKKISILGSPLKCNSTMKVPTSCFGITCLSSNIVVSCEDCLRMYTCKGKLVFVLSQRSNGKPLFKRATFLGSDKFRDVIFASDEGDNSVFALQTAHRTLISCPKYIYKHSQLRCPQGIGVSSDGSILVCGFGSKNIHNVNQNGTLIRIIDTAVRPWNVEYLSCQNLFMMSVYPEKDDNQNLYVYEILTSDTTVCKESMTEPL